MLHLVTCMMMQPTRNMMLRSSLITLRLQQTAQMQISQIQDLDMDAEVDVYSVSRDSDQNEPFDVTRRFSSIQ